jgi:phage-related protein
MTTTETKKEAEQSAPEELELEPAKSKVSASEKEIKIQTKKTVEEVEKKLTQAYGKFRLLPVYLLLAILAILAGLQAHKISQQKNDIAAIGERVKELQTQTAVEIVNNRRIFVCNMEEIYKQLNINERNTDFELKIAKLDNDVTAAQKKIKNLKNAKVKADFTDVYLNSLVAKRDKVVEEYQDALHDTMAKINRAMAEVAVEKKATTIFRSQAVTALTKYTIDVTQDILDKINEMK